MITALPKECMERAGYQNKVGDHLSAAQHPFARNTEENNLWILCRIPTPWRNPACSAFPTAPADVTTGPCDPWWSDFAPASTPRPHAQTQGAGSGHSAPPHTAWPPVERHRPVTLNWKAAKMRHKSISYHNIGDFWWNKYLVRLPGKVLN